LLIKEVYILLCHPQFPASLLQAQPVEDDNGSNCEEDLEYNENPFDGNSSHMALNKDSEEPVEVSYPKLLNLCTMFCAWHTNSAPPMFYWYRPQKNLN
jgi:hypothetical protein